MSSGARILIAEDEPNSSSALKELLEDAGYEVATAKVGLQALNLVPVFRPDLVLSDVRMPGMDGVQLAEEIHLRANGSSPAIILMSARPRRGELPFISKPIQLEELLAAIERELTARARNKDVDLTLLADR